jgi:hypothetical protein
VLSILDDVALLDQDLMNWLVGEVRYQSELIIRNYQLSIKRPSSIALGILCRTLDKLEGHTRGAKDSVVNSGAAV